ncbi:RNA polymerase factor sigma-54 [Acetohalobium arabaticum]|uniref:RNA polymerase, sigma 54 subunit, RpoN n=1 Tax=Acetohalobium arabaticum (strain ATCC 49924 / DSM 5501 / Z-7288) TaxID=574087 RepID=D9QU76_ACEAZ|nr:RNA polymerase factor sigma-54 [Acetohalobium arabaticum]ADL11869.1 RNA polymerase, sigma 54 subunit, RpoN [Acetohalobium arabaticum DSM 5501]
MKLTPEISLEQKQELIMTPKLQQAIELLQLSKLELNQRLEQEMLENPVLERAEEEGEEVEEDLTDEFEDVDWEDYFVDSSSNYKVNNYDQDEDEYNYENFVSASLTLEEHLLHQLHLLQLSSQQIKIGEYIIGSLDNNGFLDTSITQLSKELKVEESGVEEVLAKIQQFDPTGVAAKDLQDSLLIQIDNLVLEAEKKELMNKIVTDHFELVSKNQLRKLSKELSIGLEKIQQLVDLIKMLHPNPANLYTKEVDTKYIEPDLIVEKINGRYVVTMEQDSTPRLRINAYYQKLLKKFKSDAKAKEYLQEKINSALWLIKSIEQRRMTIYRIAEVIVDLQQEFLERGLKYLRPMTMQDVAEEIDMHESTVSRATTSKYIQTPRGLFELKFFFSPGLETKTGEVFSAISIKKMIKDILAKEDKKKPLSDQKIADKLEERGVEVSRRTVSKYRNELEIPSSTQRRRYS